MEPEVIHCPIYKNSITICDIQELNPLLDYLNSHDEVRESQQFLRGTLRPDGRLDLCKQSIGPKGAKKVANALWDNSYVRSVMLGTDGIGDEGSEAVAELIDHNKNLHTVYLGCNMITHEGVTKLADALKKNDNIKGLWLKRNPIGLEGAQQLAELLAENQSITTLDVVNTNIDSEGARVILQALKTNSSLERIYIGGNGLGPEIAPAIAEMIQCNTTLRGLFLNVGELGNAGVQQIAEAFHEDSALDTLGLASNNIGHDGLTALCDNLEKMKISWMDLGYSPSTKILGKHANMFGNSGAEKLADWISNTTTLSHLTLCKNRITQEGWDCLIDALEKNHSLIKFHHDSKLPEIKTRIRKLLQRNQQFPGRHSKICQDVRFIKSSYR